LKIRTRNSRVVVLAVIREPDPIDPAIDWGTGGWSPQSAQ
jgi:hypothetical protein